MKSRVMVFTMHILTLFSKISENWGFASERQNSYSSKEIVENNMTLP